MSEPTSAAAVTDPSQTFTADELEEACAKAARDTHDLVVLLGGLLDSLYDLTDRRFRITEVASAPDGRIRVMLSAPQLTVNLLPGGDVIVFAEGLQADEYELRCYMDGLDAASMAAMESILHKLQNRSNALDAAAQKAMAEANPKLAPDADSEPVAVPASESVAVPASDSPLMMPVDVVAALLHAVMGHNKPTT